MFPSSRYVDTIWCHMFINLSLCKHVSDASMQENLFMRLISECDNKHLISTTQASRKNSNVSQIFILVDFLEGELFNMQRKGLL